MSCVICDKIKLIKKNEFNFLIEELKHTYWILGDHQFFKGYSQLIFKEHVRDLHQLEEKTQLEIFSELMYVEKKLRNALDPWKTNLSLYGNVVPHIHWHIFPRFETEEDCKKIPWNYRDLPGVYAKPTLGTRFCALSSVKNLFIFPAP